MSLLFLECASEADCKAPARHTRSAAGSRASPRSLPFSSMKSEGCDTFESSLLSSELEDTEEEEGEEGGDTVAAFSFLCLRLPLEGGLMTLVLLPQPLLPLLPSLLPLLPSLLELPCLRLLQLPLLLLLLLPPQLPLLSLLLSLPLLSIPTTEFELTDNKRCNSGSSEKSRSGESGASNTGDDGGVLRGTSQPSTGESATGDSTRARFGKGSNGPIGELSIK